MNSTISNTFGGKTADQWREMERDCYRRKQESWERSDTDGFLSQWAADQMASRYAHMARIAEAGGVIETAAFVDIETGELIKGQWRQAQFGAAYAPVDRNRKWIFPSYAKNPATRAKNNAAKGVREVTVRIPVLLDERQMEVYHDVDAAWSVIEPEGE